MMPEDYCDDDYGINPYESFMRKHLQHYGYYTGKNQNYKNQFQQYAEWEKNYAYNLSSSSSEESDSDSDDEDKNGDSKLQEELRRTTQIIYSCGESGKMIPRLREPRSLYALNKELGPQQAARWPSDIQVVNERIRHIQTLPPEPEPFYKQTGMEKCPMVRGEANGGRVVFRYETNSSFFMKSRVGGSRNGCDLCAVSLESENDTTLIFESRFESGNLGKVVQIGESEYELWLRYDLYTNKHTQWFYFRVSNTRANKEYRFTIVNFMKPDSLYNDGMRPVMYSEKEAALNKVGWVRGGQDIKYYKNNMRYEMGRADRYYYSMTWTAKMKHDHDTVYFSHCYPYTYTDLQDYLLEVSNDPIKSRICKQRVLCRTLAGNLIYVLTITSASQNPEDMKHKKAVVVTSRVHPGESNASWMMKGFLDFITSSSPDAKLLRDTFIFKVVPMLNPDGVIVGNYRCSLAGRDLNRNYKTSLKDAYPSVWHTKNMIRKLLLERDIIVYCDLHGHSRRQNVFIYGCEQRHGSNKRFHEKVFPSMLSKNTPEKFSFKACKFKVQKSKEGTGRVVMWNMGIMNSYTLEATFCGSSLGKKKGFHFNQRDFEMMGYHFCDTLLDYCDPDNTKYTKIMVELEDKHQMEVMTKMAEKGLQGQNVEVVSDISTDTESSDGGSDSSVSDGPPVHLQYAAARPKKKKLKSKKDRDKVRVGKEDLKRLLPQQEERRMRNNQVKPLKQDPSKGQPIRYTSNSPKRLMDERSNSGIPVFVQERFDEKQQKRHDYLEALTAAYISNNIPITNDPGDTDTDLSTADGARHLEEDAFVHFRYSGTTYERPPNPQPLEGLCAHHEQTLAAQLAAAQAQSGASHHTGQFQAALRDLELRRLTPKWLQEAAVKMIPLCDVRRADAPNMEDLLRHHLNHPASITPLDRRHKPHLLEVSAAQQRQTDALSRDKNSSIKTHPNPFDEKAESARRGSDTDRSSIHMKSHVPSATNYVNYNTFKVTSIKEEPGSQNGSQTMNSGRGSEESGTQKTGHKDKDRSGRKSRKGMREEDETDEQELGSVVSGQEFDARGKLASRPPKVKSAESSENMASALSSIQEIQKSLEEPTQGQGQNQEQGGAGEYIQKLIKETNDEIQELTHEIQEDIEKKQQHSSRLLFRKMPSRHNREQGSHREGSENRGGAGGQQKMKLNMGYHGATFVNDLGSAKASEDRYGGGYLAGRSAGVGGSAGLTQGGNGRTSNEPRPDVPLSYSGASMPTVDPAKLPGGPNLMVASTRQRQTPIEEEAHTRSLKRQTNFTPSLIKTEATIYTVDNRSLPTAEREPASSSGHMNSLTPSLEEQDSSSHHRHGNSAHLQQPPVRLNRQNLVFRSAADGSRVTTPRGPSQQSEHLGDQGESLESRARSARCSSRQVVETVPTKISLMICSDHPENSPTPTGGHFQPLSRQGVRPPIFRQQGRKK